MGEANQLKHRTGRRQDVQSATSPPTPTQDDFASKSSQPTRFRSMVSASNFAILTIGALLGYLIIPIIVVETSSFIDMDAYSTAAKTDSSSYRSLRTLAEGEKPEVETRIKHLVEDKVLLSRQSLPTDRAPLVMQTAVLSDHRRKKILVTGGAGFVGSHLVDKLMMEGHEVTVVDNLFTGQKKNVAHWFHHPNFK